MRYVKDLLVTDDFLIRGHVATGGRRLTDFLNATPRAFLEVDEATIVRHRGGAPDGPGAALVKVDEVLLAHELVEAGGDEGLRALAADADRELTGIRLELACRSGLSVTGRVGRRLFADLGANRFIVVDSPEVAGFFGLAGGVPGPIRDLRYLIVNRTRVALASRTD